MLKAMIPMLLLAGAATAATPGDRAEKDAASLNRDLAGLTAGKPQVCIRHLEARSSRIYGSTVLFRVSGRLVYRNDTQGDCVNSGMQTALVTASATTSLCSGDPAKTIDPQAGFLTGTCTLGRFVPYRR